MLNTYGEDVNTILNVKVNIYVFLQKYIWNIKSFL